jgi:phospholipase D1/2
VNICGSSAQPDGAKGKTHPQAGGQLPIQVFVTAAEAYPALERAFLAARHEVIAGFRVFDLGTGLRCPEGRAVGKTWLDLVAHTLRRGVAVKIILSDFDPVARPRLHRATWRTVRMLYAAAEMAGPGARLTVVPAMHDAAAGLAPRTLLWPMILSRLMRTTDWLRGLLPPLRQTALRDMPGVRRLLTNAADDRPRPRLLPVPPLFPVTHHQKLAVFDGCRLYIGGLDLDERRYDTPSHRLPGHETWHDVQLMVEGPVAGDARAHLQGFLTTVAANAPPAAATPDRQGLRLVRTLSRRRVRGAARFLAPEPLVAEIEEAHHHAIGQASRLIYIETQYFRDRRLSRLLAAEARRKPDLQMILILPAAPDDVAFDGATGLDARLGEFHQARALRILKKAFGQRLFVGGAAQPRRTGATGREQLHGAPLVYIHAKVSIFDDHQAIVSSANLNGRSLRWDTEAGLVLSRPEEVKALRLRLMSHWLPERAGKPFFDPDTAVRAWAELAARNARTAPEQRRGFLLPYDIRSAEVFGRDLPLLPEELV